MTSIKNRSSWVLLLCALAFGAMEARAADAWKVPVPEQNWGLSVMAGLGITAIGAGGAITGAFSRRIVSQTAIRDISNDLHVELQMGPALIAQTAIGLLWSLPGSALGRWDFHLDERWSFFALGGLGWSTSFIGGLAQWNFFPRFGVGAFFRLAPFFALRGEISHEQTVVGGTFFF